MCGKPLPISISISARKRRGPWMMSSFCVKIVIASVISSEDICIYVNHVHSCKQKSQILTNTRQFKRITHIFFLLCIQQRMENKTNKSMLVIVVLFLISFSFDGYFLYIACMQQVWFLFGLTNISAAIYLKRLNNL